MNNSIIQTGVKNIKMLPQAFKKLKSQLIGLKDNAIENQTPINEKVSQKFKKVVGAKGYLDFSSPKAGMDIQEMNRLELLYKGLVKSALAISAVPFLMEYVGTGLIKINSFLWHHLGDNAKEFLHNSNIALNEKLGNKYTFNENSGKWINNSFGAVNLTEKISDKLNAIASGAVTTAGLTLGGIGVVKGFKAIKNKISNFFKEKNQTLNNNGYDNVQNFQYPQLSMPRPDLKKDGLENGGWTINDTPDVQKADEHIDNFEQPQNEAIELGMNNPEEDINFDLETEPKEQSQQNIENPILEQPLYIHKAKPMFSNQEKEQLNIDMNDELKYKLEDNYNYLNEKAMNSYITPEEKTEIQRIENDFNRLDNVSQNAMTSDAAKYSIYAELETLDNKEFKTPYDIERMEYLDNLLTTLGQDNQKGGRTK